MYITVKDARNGFTLIELLVVIAIVGTLAAIAFPNYIKHRDKAACAATETDAFNIMRSLTDYFSIPVHANIVTPVDITGNVANGLANEINGLKYPLLSGSNTALVTTSPSGGYKIVVEEASQRCDKKYQQGNIIWSDWKCTLTF